ncbi:hypothetical protein Bra5_CH00310 [Rhizobium phaseoli Brasil 5]|nr:hypothetical protein Bra5_CH00310 [Rhizobium phaseoli Brasil 5]
MREAAIAFAGGRQRVCATTARRKVALATRLEVSIAHRFDFSNVQLVESGPPCHFPGFERGSHE